VPRAAVAPSLADHDGAADSAAASLRSIMQATVSVPPWSSVNVSVAVKVTVPAVALS